MKFNIEVYSWELPKYIVYNFFVGDYKMLMGEDIPYVRLGYKNLEEFLVTVDSLTTSRGPSGEMLIDAKASKETAHITSMINKQKSKKKR